MADQIQYQIPVGWPVQWFMGADKSTEPAPAVVFRQTGPNMVSLLVGQTGSRKNVRHVSDPYLATRPEYRLKSGGWDFIPGMPLPPEVPRAVPLSELLTEEELKAEILRLHGEGLGHTEIAEKLGVLHQKVTAVVRYAEHMKNREPANA